MKPVLLAVVCLLSLVALSSAVLRAGVAKIDGTLPDKGGVGVPLAGFNHGERRFSWWPLFNTGEKYCNWMNPSQGIIDPTWVKALVIDDGRTPVAFLTLDMIGASGSVMDIAYAIAVSRGFTVPRANVIMSASHTHSGPGAVSPEFLWAVAPATDLMVPSLQWKLSNSIADALVSAQASLQPATIGLSHTNLTGVTRNRRAGRSPYVNATTIDPNLSIISVNDLQGNPIATLWNFATHVSGDIMGKACEFIEKSVGGVALFVNADAGDIDPTAQACSQQPNFYGAQIIASTVAKLRSSTPTTGVFDMIVAAAAAVSQLSLTTASVIVPFGFTNLNATLERFGDCSSGGPLDICTICKVLQCDLNAHLGMFGLCAHIDRSARSLIVRLSDSAWIENEPRFTAIRFDIGGRHILLVTLPGEPLYELGQQVYGDMAALGFDHTILAGYSNNHMGYFATPREYDVGGYESQLTLWGRDTAEQIRAGCKTAAVQVVP
ncbi:Ceramidase [Acanthamoeba castellanii str. Neff]|uniref:Neutral ceramidase n=1 Tax=Acanthamoeba castellanii (strain ATCC 30010 / Neff) TaxID=1257118 RepID=L8GFC5_ACACF|nr:Ceramidase [Acanthamoeba castellanii str. Neff]ELR11785.1 Ceramidase [Acanthamoeba castellanii str. Neff]